MSHRPSGGATASGRAPEAVAPTPSPHRGTRGRVRRILAWLDRDAAAVALVVALGVLAFSPWLLGGRIFAPLDLLDGFYQPWAGESPRARAHNHATSDAVTQYLVYRRIAEESYAEDGRVGWSDRTFGGRPEHANTMAGYGDWTMQLHRFLDFWTAWHLGLLGQFLVAGLGMLVFLRSGGAPPLVGAVGAVAYAANSQFVLWIYHRWQLGAFAWVPWLLWSVDTFRRGRCWAWPLPPVFLALAFLGGSLQTAAFIALVLVAAWLGWAVEWSPRFRIDLRLTLDLAVWFALGAGLAAFALLPAASAYIETMAVGLDRGGIGYARGLAQPLLDALLVPAQAFPTLLGHPRTIDATKALGLDYFAVAYFGLLPAVLAWRATLRRDAPAVARWLVALGLLLPLTPLVGPLYHRVQLLYVLGGVWAFAWYWTNADHHAHDPLLRAILTGLLVLAAGWLLASLASLLVHDRLVAMAQAEVMRMAAQGRAGTFGFHHDWLLERAHRFVVEMRIWHPRQAIPVAMALLAFYALRLRRDGRLRTATAILLLALTVELGAFAAGWVTVVDPEEHPPYAELPDLAAIREPVGEGRVQVYRDEGRPTILLPSNTLVMYGLKSIQQYETITFPGAWHALGYAEDARALGFLAVEYAVSLPDRTLPDGWEPVYLGRRLWLWRNPYALPRYAALGPGVTWPATPAELPPDPKSLLAGEVRVLEATQNLRRLEAPAGAVALRIAENWHDGWEFRVDGAGAWTPAERAADRTMLVPLPQAASPVNVQLRYHPPLRAAGFRLGAVSLAALLLGTILSARGAGSISPSVSTWTRRARRTPPA